MNSAPAPQIAPLLDVVLSSLAGEPARHQGEVPSHEVWEAQADAFGNKLTARLIEVTAEEIKAALGDTICLHKAFYALGPVAEQLAAAYQLATFALVQADGA